MSNSAKHHLDLVNPGIRLKLALKTLLNMSNENKFDARKRRSMKTLASMAAIGTLAHTQAIAGILSSGTAEAQSAYDVLECMLILRADNTRLHMLMRNIGETDVVISGFESQELQFDNTKLNISDALAQTVAIKPQERTMVRLSLENSLRPKAIVGSEIDLNSVTSSLSQGTRVVTIAAQVRHGVGTLVNTQESSLAMNAWSAMYSSKLQVS